MTDSSNIPIAIRDRSGIMFQIKMKKGGPTPESLSGSYTREMYAQDAIDKYLEEKNRPKKKYRKPGEKKNAKIKSTTTGAE